MKSNSDGDGGIEKQKKAHFIGIAGVGMSATAKLFIDDGWEVSGSDTDFYPPVSNYIKKLPIKFFDGYKAKNIPSDVDLIVIGRNAKLNPDINVEVKRAEEMSVEIQSFPECVANFFVNKHRVVVAGSYGKSTIASLLSWVLVHAEKNPSYFIGAFPVDLKHPSRKDSGKIAIIEGDEYPSSYCDDRSKFFHLNADDVLLTSVKHDHINVFPTYKEYQQQFINLLKNMPKQGLLVACADSDRVLDILNHAPQSITYGLSEKALWKAHNIKYGETTTFELVNGDQVIVELNTKLLGRHNIQNIVGVATLLLTRKLVTPKELQSAISAFSGVHRRLNKITNVSKVAAYEGFGSSFEKARSAIEAMKLHYPKKKLFILFEPHAFSLRNRGALPLYDTIFNGVDSVFVFSPSIQGADTHEQLTQEEIVGQIKKSDISVQAVQNDNVYDKLKDVLSGDHILLVLTSGNLHGILDKLPGWLNENFL